MADEGERADMKSNILDKYPIYWIKEPAFADSEKKRELC